MRERSGGWIRANHRTLRAFVLVGGTAVFWSRPLGSLVLAALAVLVVLRIVIAVVMRPFP
ncbi:hypothetical protein [Actinomadura macrotermitis]|uniref:Uncharacterized protein n=1 Tax=Actinomadura macrotermitis TaxID=2585200 RepID=A0A7K0C769_9ACTN|nr:hypothetical protein [Actinomadura macrotermitis]MQY09311.1 hypothetical protein [Actinomadura macrotermitis]